MANLNLAEKRLGEVKTMECGLRAKIIEYNNARDIKVKFEDGTIRKSAYYHFRQGTISNKLVITSNMAEDRLGEVKTMECGLKAEIIEYYNNNKIVVKFENGVIKNTTYDYFRKGLVSTRLRKRIEVGEVKTMNCGMKAEIIGYNSSKDITIKFEDGTIKRTDYRSFRERKVTTVSREKEGRLGEVHTMNCGMKAKIIDYIDSANIIVEFENGIKKKATYGRFKNGQISSIDDNHRNTRLGEVRVMNCGLRAEIIEYNNTVDIKVRFENGDEKHSSYKYFSQGRVLPSSISNIRHSYNCKNTPYYLCRCDKCNNSFIFNPQELREHLLSHK